MGKDIYIAIFIFLVVSVTFINSCSEQISIPSYDELYSISKSKIIKELIPIEEQERQKKAKDLKEQKEKKKIEKKKIVWVEPKSSRVIGIMTTDDELINELEIADKKTYKEYMEMLKQIEAAAPVPMAPYKVLGMSKGKKYTKVTLADLYVFWIETGNLKKCSAAKLKLFGFQ